ncbi:MAG: hypothetical protein ABIT20_05020 [Gemmatimonadaceae bacterium]
MTDHHENPFGDDDVPSAADDHEEEVEEAREEGFEEGKDKGQTQGFYTGCLFGIALTFVAMYMGWCSPYTR